MTEREKPMTPDELAGAIADLCKKHGYDLRELRFISAPPDLPMGEHFYSLPDLRNLE